MIFDFSENEDLLEMVEIEESITKNQENIDMIEEANINTKDISAPHKGNSNYRYIMITGSGSASHAGRMKVSKNGVRISRTTSHKDYISIHKSTDNTIVYEGDLKEIKMNNSEYQYYVDLFIRNQELIQLVKTGKYDNYIDNAIIEDENARLSGLIVKRDATNGNAEVYNTAGQLLYRKNIKGEMI